VLTDWLRPAGYATANLVRLTNDPKEKFLRGTGKTDWNFHYEGGQKAAFDFDRWDDLRRHTPFYAQINFAETHRGRAWNRAHERIEQPADPDRVVLPPYYPDHSVARADWAQYLNTVMALDRKVAHVLDRLERDGLADDTVVIFFADHGRAHIRGKQWVYDSGTRVPLIIRWARSHPPPSGFVPGSVDDRLVSTIDLTATTLSIAGLENPPALQGRVFLGPDDEGPRQYVFAGRDRGDETVDRVRTVRDTRYRYLRNYHPDQPLLQLNRYKEATYPMLPLLRELASHDRLTEVQARLLAPTRPPEELYDTKLDPHEVHNLAESAEHAEHLARLRRALDAWIERIDDQGRVREDPEVVARYLRQMQRNYDRRIRKIYQRKGLPSPLDDG